MAETEWERLAELAKAATPGPWVNWSGNPWMIDTERLDTEFRRHSGGHIAAAALKGASYPSEAYAESVANGNFIAAANPDAITRLLAERDALAEKVNELEGQVEGLHYALQYPEG